MRFAEDSTRGVVEVFRKGKTTFLLRGRRENLKKGKKQHIFLEEVGGKNKRAVAKWEEITPYVLRPWGGGGGRGRA